MSNEITIGQSYYDTKIERYSVAVIECPNAPRFKNDELTGSTNFRSMAFHNCQETMQTTKDLWSLFYGFKDRKLPHRQHLKYPAYLDSRDTNDVAIILPPDLEIIKEAVETRLQQSKLPPGFGDASNKDPVLARLIWLRYWVERSLKLDNNPSAMCL